MALTKQLEAWADELKGELEHEGLGTLEQWTALAITHRRGPIRGERVAMARSARREIWGMNLHTVARRLR